MKFNINDAVRVRLTRVGKSQLYRKFHEEGVPEKYMPKPEADDRYKFQLWELMSIFGSECVMGAAPCFVDNIVEFESQK